MRFRSFRFLVLTTVLLSTIASFAEDPVSFRRDIAAILQDNCVACHSAKKAEGGYRLDTFDELGKAGDTGAPPLPASDDPSGELLRRLTSDDEDERMPAEADALPSEQIELISKWVKTGAKFDGEDSSQLLPMVIPARQYAEPPKSYSAPVPITAVAFAPEGDKVFVGGYHEITVWSLSDRKLIRRIQNVGQRVYAIAVSPDANRLAVACGEPGRHGEVRLIEIATGKVIGVSSPLTDVVLDVAFRPKHDQLAIAAADRTIRIIDAKSAETLRTLSSHADWVTGIAWNNDGSRLVSASRDKSAKVFDPGSGQLLVSYQGHGAEVRDVEFSVDGKQVFSTGADKKLHRWNVADAKRVAAVDIGGEGYRIARSDQFAAVSGRGGRLVKVDLANNKVSQQFQGHQSSVLSAALDNKNARLVSGGFDGEVRLWNVTDGAVIANWIAKP